MRWLGVSVLAAVAVAVLQATLHAQQVAHPERFPRGVWFEAGGDSHGLTHVPEGPEGASRRATIAGRECVATDGPQNSYLWFNAYGDYIYDDNVPLRVMVEYLDRGLSKVGFELWYDSADPTAPEAGTAKRAVAQGAPTSAWGGVLLRDSGEWKTVTFYLPDARFAGGRFGSDFCLASHRWEGDPDLHVASVRVTREALFVWPDPPAVALHGGTVQIGVFGYDATGSGLPDGTIVRLTAAKGEVEREVALSHGVAEASYSPPRETGTDTITATAGELVASCRVFVVPGRGEVVLAKAVVADFEEEGEWRVRGVFRGTAEARRQEGKGQRGRAGLLLSYDITGMVEGEPNVILVDLGTPLAGCPVLVSLWTYGNGAWQPLLVHLVDAEGEVFAYRLGDNPAPPWIQLAASLDRAEAHWGGDNDGVPDLPLKLDGLQLSVREPGSGAILFDEVAVTSYMAAEEADRLGLPPGRRGFEPVPRAGTGEPIP
ncbi:MAG: hypothetical protein ACE5R4_10685 [Armatimonadota bacterium]